MGDIYPYGPPDYLPWNSVYNSLIAQHASAYEANVLASIGMAESDEDLTVINDTPATGDYSVGVFQVNYFANLYNDRVAAFGTPQQLIAGGIAAQVRAALSIAAGQGFSAWSTYNSGAYQQYLNGAGGTPPQTGPGGSGGGGQPTLQEGDTGAAVRTLQQDLDTLGAGLSVDGDFGPATRAAVVAFQAAHGLAQDGIVGPLTWAAIGTALQAGNTGQGPPSGSPPPSEPAANADPATVAEWSNLIYVGGRELGTVAQQVAGIVNAIGGIQ